MMMKVFEQLQSTGSSSMIPYLLLYLSCICWTKYGLWTQNWTCAGINMIGMVLALYELYVLDKLAINRTASRKYMALALGTLYVLLWVLHYAPMVHRSQILGLICSLGTMLMWGVPLITIWHVIKTKKLTTLTPHWYLINIICSFCWSLYGYVVHDPLIMVPNSIGTALNLCQWVLTRIYPTALDLHNNTHPISLIETDITMA
jgi:solute carrier family 50 protein (sugar transporter)